MLTLLLIELAFDLLLERERLDLYGIFYFSALIKPWKVILFLAEASLLI